MRKNYLMSNRLEFHSLQDKLLKHRGKCRVTNCKGSNLCFVECVPDGIVHRSTFVQELCLATNHQVVSVLHPHVSACILVICPLPE